ncbi:hypothetical protein FB45DRAFT_939330 [Roridomyces roridus]|uniref:Uncharacterized protein n=1 Tax=Roridomyces roridus TaxID=1738132 RepID=A0AAD7B758_9AGAR|nr:hypothetical protein FB45DRAFT_939330 [Roridomyces roridus]
MTSVIIHLVTGVDLDDDTVEAMARSWRRVERLELQAQFGNPAPRASVGCLRAFVKYCPNLVGLYMTFDARVIPPSLDESPIIQKSLESLIVATSPIEVESAQSIAEFMAGVFPSLKDVRIMPGSRAMGPRNMSSRNGREPTLTFVVGGRSSLFC